MDGLGYSCALLLAAAFVRAGAAKAARPAATAASFAALGVPAPRLTARAVPVVELVVAAALLAAPIVGGAAAALLLGLFTVLLARALAAGVSVPCNCFGTARAEPVSRIDVVRNVVLGALAVAAGTAGPRPVVPSPAAAVVALGAFATGFTLLVALRRRRG